MQSQYLAHLDLVREMQGLGYHYSAEDCGAFGISRCGPSLSTRLNNLFMWSDAITQFDAAAITASGSDPDEIFFRGLAYRLMWMVGWDPKRDRLSFRQSGWRTDADSPTDRHLKLLRIFNSVQSHIECPDVIGDEQAVIYTDSEGVRVVWCFESTEVPLYVERWSANRLTDDTLCAEADVEDLITGVRCRRNRLNAKSGHVYRITPASPGEGR